MGIQENRAAEESIMRPVRTPTQRASSDSIQQAGRKSYVKDSVAELCLAERLPDYTAASPVATIGLPVEQKRRCCEGLRFDRVTPEERAVRVPTEALASLILRCIISSE